MKQTQQIHGIANEKKHVTWNIDDQKVVKWKDDKMKGVWMKEGGKKDVCEDLRPNNY